MEESGQDVAKSSGIRGPGQKERKKLGVKQKTRTIREDHPGFCFSETSGEPSISKWFEYSRWLDTSQ